MEQWLRQGAVGDQTHAGRTVEEVDRGGRREAVDRAVTTQ